ncbi:unnamed protein product [Lampetra planeri]
MGQWEAKLAMLTEAFDRFMVTERVAPMVSGQSPHDPAPPVVADDAAATPATPRTEPDAGFMTPATCGALRGKSRRLDGIYAALPSSIARNIETNLDLRDKPIAVAAQPLVVCAGAAGCPMELEEPGSLAAAAGLSPTDVLRVRATRTLPPGLLATQRHFSKGAGRLQPRISPIPGSTGKSRHI